MKKAPPIAKNRAKEKIAKKFFTRYFIGFFMVEAYVEVYGISKLRYSTFRKADCSVWIG